MSELNNQRINQDLLYLEGPFAKFNLPTGVLSLPLAALLPRAVFCTVPQLTEHLEEACKLVA